ncbi:ATP-binding protein [Olsenella intestinalis]|uniref:ATP-binding protein n=1 Tax=Olsenella intestinalis TaxID=2930083 RepID=UPI00200DD23C|nr:ATP-binding protein [Olsenella intestinalis]
MDARTLSDIHFRLSTLAVFRALLADEVIGALNEALARAAVLAAGEETGDDAMAHADAYELSMAYAEFVSRLYAAGAATLADYVRDAVLEDENAYLLAVAEGRDAGEAVEAAARGELAGLQRVCDLTAADLTGGLPAQMREALPGFGAGSVDLAATYRERLARIGVEGFGIYARYHVFRVEGGEIVPVRHPDAQRLCELVGYEREKGVILENTRALLAGLPAANILLTGDAGTGKSSTIKAVANELAGEGLRILEVRKEQLREIPALLDELTRNPLKFVIFIDDLSFSAQDDNFAALKAILEGSVSAKSDNVVIYATSNRRHLVRERFSDREGDDVHRSDTIQEIISLSDRFGIRVTFLRPDKEAYLEIVRRLAADEGLDVDEEELALEAERFATRRGGRSARGARQFVDRLVREREAGVGGAAGAEVRL